MDKKDKRGMFTRIQDIDNGDMDLSELDGFPGLVLMVIGVALVFLIANALISLVQAIR